MARLVRRAGSSVWRFFGGRSLVRNRPPARRRPPAPDEMPAGDDAQRFRAAVRQYRLDEAALRRRYRREAIRCHVLLGGALFAASFGATSAYLTFGGALAMLAILMALWFVAGAAGSALRAWQIRQRRLCAFGEWAKTPAAWFPSLF